MGKASWRLHNSVLFQPAAYDSSPRSGSATTLLPGQDNSVPSAPTSRSAWFVVSCGVRLSEIGLAVALKRRRLGHRSRGRGVTRREG
jgi:hypothetical protein